MMGVEEEEERPLFHGVPLFVFFRQSVRKEVWVEVPKGTKHPPVLLEVLIGVGR